MRLFNNIQKAVFISRPNRFTIICDLKGKEIKAYLPNPGRLWELLFPETVLYIEKAQNKERKLPYTVVGVNKNGAPVMLHTHKTNDAVAFLIEKGMIPGLEGAKIIKKEAKKGHSRFDFLLEKGATDIYLEVKSCSLFDGKIAMFPDAPTLRGKKHIEELARISNKKRQDAAVKRSLRSGELTENSSSKEKFLRCNSIEGMVLFFVNSPEAKIFLPCYHTDPDFTNALYSARNKISIIPISVKWNKSLALSSDIKLLKLPWDIVERESKDSGCYMVILRLTKGKSIEIGKLGKISFKSGYYIYVGSAKKNLGKRIERHKKLRKKLFWHIDYLRAESEIITTIPVRSADDLECKLAVSLKKISDKDISGFGSSDCLCAAHLFKMSSNPLRSKAFQDLLLYFRMGRLEKLTIE